MERPDHPDLERLAAIVRGMDEDGEQGLKETGDRVVLMATDVDPTSLVYVAQQRSIRARMVAPDDEDPRTPTAREAMVWMDGFVAGQRFTKNHSNDLMVEFAKDFDDLLGLGANKIDGNRRQRRGKGKRR